MYTANASGREDSDPGQMSKMETRSDRCCSPLPSGNSLSEIRRIYFEDFSLTGDFRQLLIIQTDDHATRDYSNRRGESAGVFNGLLASTRCHEVVGGRQSMRN